MIISSSPAWYKMKLQIKIANVNGDASSFGDGRHLDGNLEMTLSFCGKNSFIITC